MMKMGCYSGLRGEYELVVRKAGSGIITRQLKFHNLITDIGLDRIGSNESALNYLMVGTGTSAESVFDTQLGNFKAMKHSVVTDSAGSSPAWIASTTFTQTFNPGEATGNLTEVGAGWRESGTPNTDANLHRCFSRALIRDEDGDPVAITILADEYLTLSYTIYHHRNVSDQTYTFDINGVTYTAVQRLRRCTLAFLAAFHPNVGRSTAPTGFFVGGTDAAMGPITGDNVINKIYFAPTFVKDAYVPGSFKVSGTAKFEPGQANVTGGIAFLDLVFSPYGNKIDQEYQMSISPPIPKTSSYALNLVVETSWGRY